MMRDAAVWIQLPFLLYFLGLAACYLLLDAIALLWLPRYMRDHSLDMLPQARTWFEPPVSLIVPAHNEAATIESSLRSLLQLSYPEYEIVVVNDGSTDATLDVLVKAFSLVPFPEAYRIRLPCRPVRAIYRSTVHTHLRVIDKGNGGKADALNAGINAARYPLFCSMDSDSVLQRDSLQRVVRPFLEDPRTVAAGGTVRIVNGCEVQGGFVTRVGLPRSPLAMFQVLEYLRAFLFGRMGWSPLNAVPLVSGAFGLFHRETVVAAGGYRTDTVGEDMELVLRLHRRLRQEGRPYRIVYVPDPICWTEAPEDLGTLMRQRIRWQRGLSDSLVMNRALLFHPRGGIMGWVCMPYLVLFEWLNPLVLAGGYVLVFLTWLAGFLSLTGLLAFLLLEVGLGILLSVTALLMEEATFHVYPRPRHILELGAAALLENLGYRQLNAFWRVVGLWRWATGSEAHWGAMARKGTWGSS